MHACLWHTHDCPAAYTRPPPPWQTTAWPTTSTAAEWAAHISSVWSEHCRPGRHIPLQSMTIAPAILYMQSWGTGAWQDTYLQHWMHMYICMYIVFHRGGVTANLESVAGSERSYNEIDKADWHAQSSLLVAGTLSIRINSFFMSRILGWPLVLLHVLPFRR